MGRTRVCSYRGCPELVTDGLRCEKHPYPKRVYKTHRLTNKQRGYGVEHRRWRDAVLKRDPVCVDCKATRSTEAHHIDGNTSNRELDNGMGLCRLCHNRRTHGRFGNVDPPSRRLDRAQDERWSSESDFWFV